MFMERKEPFDFLKSEQKDEVVRDILTFGVFYMETAEEDLGIPMTENDKKSIGTFIHALTQLIDGKDMFERLAEVQEKLEEEDKKKKEKIKDLFKKGV